MATARPGILPPMVTPYCRSSAISPVVLTSSPMRSIVSSSFIRLPFPRSSISVALCDILVIAEKGVAQGIREGAVEETRALSREAVGEGVVFVAEEIVGGQIEKCVHKWNRGSCE